MKNSLLPRFWKERVFHPISFYTLLVVGLTPSLWIVYHSSQKNSELENLSYKLEMLHKRSSLSQNKKNKEEQVLAYMREADPYYLDKYVESLTFLDPEIKKWQRLFTEKPVLAIEQRLEFLRSDKNKLLFAEGEILKEGIFREVEEKQKHPIEVNEDDLKKILCLLEGVKISPYAAPEKHPQILIKQFDLTKKMHPEIKEKVFVLSMHLLKRELINESSP